MRKRESKRERGTGEREIKREREGRGERERKRDVERKEKYMKSVAKRLREGEKTEIGQC